MHPPADHDDPTVPGVRKIVRLAARALGVPSMALWLGGALDPRSGPRPWLDLRLACSHGPSTGLPPRIDPLAIGEMRVALIDDLAAPTSSRRHGAARMAAPWARACGVARIERGGACWGLLGALDPKPHPWSPGDAELLLDYAELIAELIDRDRVLAQCRGVLDSLPGALLVCDRDMRVTLAAGTDLGRRGFADLAGKRLGEALDANPRALYEKLVSDAFAGETSACEVGSDTEAFEVSAAPLRRQNGDVLAAVVTLSDVTARLAAVSAQRASEQRHQQLFEKAGEAIYIVQADGANAGAILEANAAAAEMYGYSIDELCRMTETDLKAPEDREVTCRRIHRIGGVNWIESEAIHVRKDGTRFPVAFSAGPLDVGADRFVLTFARDVTEQQRTERALREATRAADAASRAKSAFLANMSHEIRTPLNAILGYAQLLARDAALGVDQRQHVGVITQSGEQVLALMNDVLELSKLEVGHSAREDMDLTALLADIEQSFRARAAQKRLSFTMKRASDLPHRIVGDEGRIRHVLVNLLSNAVKFTLRGGVKVSAKFIHGSDGDGRLRVDVEDTGPGIARDILTEVFQPFVQVRVGIVAQGGTGLGLAVSREFARAMGGDVSVESEVGRGSVFRFEVPAAVGGGSAPAPRPMGRVVGIAGQESVSSGPSQGPGLIRVLVADDDERDRSWMSSLLAQVGFDVREAESGAEAVAVVDAFRPHLALVAVDATARDGNSALRAIRRRPAARKSALIALVPPSTGDGRDSAIDATADGWLTKPCSEADLFDEVKRRLRIEYRYADTAPATHASVAPGPAELGQMPFHAIDAGVREQVLAALRVADYEGLLAAVERIGPEQAEMASALRALIETYAYEVIEDLLREPAASSSS